MDIENVKKHLCEYFDVDKTLKIMHCINHRWFFPTCAQAPEALRVPTKDEIIAMIHQLVDKICNTDEFNKKIVRHPIEEICGGIYVTLTIYELPNNLPDPYEYCWKIEYIPIVAFNSEFT